MLAMLAGVPGKLKSLINQVDPITLPPIAGGIGTPVWRPDGNIDTLMGGNGGLGGVTGTKVSAGMGFWKSYRAPGTAINTPLVATDITGKGVLHFCAFEVSLDPSRTASFTVSLIIDGVTHSLNGSMSTTVGGTSKTDTAVFVGNPSWGIDHIPFNQSLQISMVQTGGSGNSLTMRSVYKYRQVA